MALRLRVLTQIKKVFDSDVDFVRFEALDGSVGVLEGHSPLAAVLKKSSVKCRHNGSEASIEINGGFAKVMPDIVSILAVADA